MNNYEEFVKDQIVVMTWINHLQFILAMQKKGMYQELLDDTCVFGKIMQVLEEYTDIIFGDDIYE